MSDTKIMNVAAHGPMAHEAAAASNRRGPGLLAWLGDVLPTGLVLVLLGGLGYLGHRTGWTIPRFSELVGNTVDVEEDWCAEHGVPESICVECNESLLP